MFGQSSLRIQHINYFNHVLELFKPYLSKDFKLKTRSFVDKRTNNSYSSVNFATLSLPCFNYYKNLFYISDDLKIVPSNIQDFLSPAPAPAPVVRKDKGTAAPAPAPVVRKDKGTAAPAPLLGPAFYLYLDTNKELVRRTGP
jgi:LAGLIDADG DNA endonuclease family